MAADNWEESRGYFKWIASDGWAGQLPTTNIPRYTGSLEGTLGFLPIAEKLPGLRQRMGNLTVSWSPRNPWAAEYLSESLSCNVPELKLDDHSRNCSSSDRLLAADIRTLEKTQNVADSMYAIAYSLDKYLRLKCNGLSEVCEEVRRETGSNQLARGVYEAMKNISFTGVNGNNVSFDHNQDGAAHYTILQFFNESGLSRNEWKKKGEFNEDTIQWNKDTLFESSVTSVCSEECEIGQAKVVKAMKCCWICQTCLANQFVLNGTSCENCPRGFHPKKSRNECVVTELSTPNFHTGLGIASTSVAIICLFSNIFIAVIFHQHRDTPLVRSTGKEFCIFFFVTSTMCFCDNFILHIRPTTLTCSISRIILAVAPTIIYSALLSKTLRIILIFYGKLILTLQIRKYLSSKFQVLSTFLLSSIQIIIAIVWLGFDPPQALAIYPDYHSGFLVCSDYQDFRVLVALVYPFILIAACTVAATMNRNVPAGFNEARHIGFTMYATCLIWISFICIHASNPNQVSLKTAALSISLNLSVLTVLFCLFAYRCYVILRKPELNNRKVVMPVTWFSHEESVSGGMTSVCEIENAADKKNQAQGIEESLPSKENETKRI